MTSDMTLAHLACLLLLSYLDIPGRLQAAIRETVATLEGCWGVPAWCGATQNRAGPRQPWGVEMCEPIATSEGCWGGAS